jgi:Na+-translocating ferredoxin:NAD+ oxidoreductase RnfG subunit
MVFTQVRILKIVLMILSINTRKMAQIGYVIEAAKGYRNINMLVGLECEIKIKILTHSETRLGKVNEIRYGEKQPWFLKQFEGKSTSDLELKDIEAITAATISSKAVLDGVKKSVEEFLVKVKQ